MNQPNNSTDQSPFGYYISVSRAAIPFQAQDSISAIDTTPTHPAYLDPNHISDYRNRNFPGYLDRPQEYLDQAQYLESNVENEPPQHPAS